MRILPRPIATAALAATLLAGGRSAPLAGRQVTRQVAMSAQDTVVVGARPRTYELHIPRAGAGAPRPLLIALHGAGDNTRDFRLGTAIDTVADRAGFLVAYPAAWPGSQRRWALRCGSCTEADAAGIDDVAFVHAVIDSVDAIAPVDRHRIYVIGFSMGAQLAYVIGCAMPETVAGIGVVGILFPARLRDACARSPAVPAAIMVGTADPAAPWEGRMAGREPMLRPDSTAAWLARRNGCAGRMATDTIPARDRSGQLIQRYTWAECPGGAEVRLYRLEGERHLWPFYNLNASSELATFLLRFRRE